MIQPTHQQPEADDEISDDSEDELSFVILAPQGLIEFLTESVCVHIIVHLNLRIKMW